MIPVWLIEADVFGESFGPLKSAIRHHGMAWDIVQPRPFLNGVVPQVGGHRLTAKDCVVFSGTYPLMRHIQLHYRWIPGGWCTAEHFDCACYYPHFRQQMLNRDHAVLGIDEALTHVEDVFARFARDGQLFVRPCGVQKTFTGRCMDREQFVSALESARYAKGAILVARPRAITDEWRLVVTGTRVVAGSRYRFGGQIDVSPGCPREVVSYVEALLADTPWRPDPIFMMDVCQAEDTLSLLELNSFSCSGLYQCDPAAVVEAVKSLAVAEWQRAGRG
jgi:hypothetical protein